MDILEGIYTEQLWHHLYLSEEKFQFCKILELFLLCAAEYVDIVDKRSVFFRQIILLCT